MLEDIPGACHKWLLWQTTFPLQALATSSAPHPPEHQLLAAPLPNVKVLGEVASPSKQPQSCPMHLHWLGMLILCWSEECCRTTAGPEN